MIIELRESLCLVIRRNTTILRGHVGRCADELPHIRSQSAVDDSRTVYIECLPVGRPEPVCVSVILRTIDRPVLYPRYTANSKQQSR